MIIKNWPITRLTHLKRSPLSHKAARMYEHAQCWSTNLRWWLGSVKNMNFYSIKWEVQAIIFGGEELVGHHGRYVYGWYYNKLNPRKIYVHRGQWIKVTQGKVQRHTLEGDNTVSDCIRTGSAIILLTCILEFPYLCRNTVLTERCSMAFQQNAWTVP
jgi:hypothetical protein